MEIEDVLLSYLDVNPEKMPSLVFIHGNSSSAETWHRQLSDPKFSEFRLIAFDLPAHGFSTADILNRYGIIEISKILSDAVINLNLASQFVLVGVSLGSNIVAEMLSFLKPSGIVLEGPTIIGDNLMVNQIFKSEVDVSVIFKDDNSKEEVYKYIKKVVYKSEESLYDFLIEDFNNVKFPFRSTLALKIKSGQLSNELQLLRNSKLEPLIVIGQEDRIINTCYLDNAGIQIWRNKPQLISNCGHLVHLDQPIEFNGILLEYVQECFTEF